MRQGFRVLDADLHTFEPHDLWERHLEPRFQGLAPRIPAGRRFDPASHLKAMDVEGIDLAVLFGTRGRHVQMRDDLDPELAEAMARAHNDWTSEFCAADPARLKFAAQIPYVDAGRAAREAARAVRELGAVAIIGNPNPVNGRHLHDPCYEPLWDAAEELAVPVCFHPTGVWGLRDDVGARFPGHAAAHMLTNAARNPMELMLAAASLIMGGVLERHPSLKCAFLEGGADWLPWWLHRLDATREKFPEDADVELSLRPSEYFLRQCFVAADPDEPGLAHVVAALGDANIVFGSDYPHRDSLHPVAVETLARRDDLQPSAKARILWDNAARLFARAVDPRAARRSLLASLAAAPLLAFIGSALAQAKQTKKAVKYRDKPNAGKDCDDCVHFVPGKSAKAMGTCAIVEGDISPRGWCAEFKEKK